MSIDGIVIGVLCVLLLVAGICLRKLYILRQSHVRLQVRHDALKSQKNALDRFIALDDLTPTQSRRYLADQIDRRVRTETHALLFVDLDDFKSVNDGYGHEVGDALLIEISKALVKTCRSRDFVARLGGDEFCVFLHGCTMDAALVVSERFRKAVADAFVTVRDITVHRTTSIGVAELHPDQSMVDSLHVADAALYQAKHKGRNRVQIADHEVLKVIRTRQERPTAEDVAQAMERDEITYFVQPIFDLNTMRPVGVEALLRWVDQEGKVHLPEVFFEAMASNYRSAVKPPLSAANHLASTFTQMDPPLFCAWNISSAFLRRAINDNPNWLDQLLLGVDPTLAVFEIVESAVIDNPKETKLLLNALRKEGVRVALDDFGTGFSNLKRLMDYPIDIVKIDRSFVMNLEKSGHVGILVGLVAMGENMGFDIIAEGVETQAQLDILRGIGICKAQGFFLGRPESVDAWKIKIDAFDIWP